MSVQQELFSMDQFAHHAQILVQIAREAWKLYQEFNVVRARLQIRNRPLSVFAHVQLGNFMIGLQIQIRPANLAHKDFMQQNAKEPQKIKYLL